MTVEIPTLGSTWFAKICRYCYFPCFCQITVPVARNLCNSLYIKHSRTCKAVCINLNFSFRQEFWVNLLHEPRSTFLCNILNTLINFLITEGLLEDMILPVRNPDTPKLAVTCMKVCLPHKMDARITGRVSACFKQVSVLTSGLCGRQLWAWGGGGWHPVSHHQGASILL